MEKTKRSFGIFIFALLMVSCFAFSAAIPASASVKDESNSYYLSEKSNVDTIHATTVGAMPCIGDARILVFYVDFIDGETLWTKTKEEIDHLFFSEEAKNDSSLAYSEKDSVRSYYYRSSYGKVDITGSVYEFTSSLPVSSYLDLSVALSDVLEHYEGVINWSDYDGNNDGYVDGIYILPKNAPAGHPLWPTSLVTTCNRTVDDKKLAHFAFIGDGEMQTYFFTILHETCHMFGPEDVYGGAYRNPAGIETLSIMDTGNGDIPSPMKFFLGWMDNVVFVDSENVGSFPLRSYSEYGDLIVVYPNGDKQNRNWFFIEYVTNDGNNSGEYPWSNTYGEYGLRIWKTQMLLDEHYNAVGDPDTIYIGTLLPPVFRFITTVHPDNILNYYMQVGDRLTPYTYPSTSYSNTFFDVGESRFPADTLYSGISISFDSLQDGVATVTVGIEKEPDLSPKKAALTALPADQSSAFLNSNDKLFFASLTAEYELTLNGSVTLSSKAGNKTFEVGTELSYNKKTLRLSLPSTLLKTLQMYDDWALSASGLTSYYGASVDITNKAQMFDFSAYQSALIRDEEVYNTGFSMDAATEPNYRFRYFKLSDTVVLSLYFDDVAHKLYWGEIDTAANTASKTELALPETLDIHAWMLTFDFERQPVEAWKQSDSYFVYIGNHICLYRDKTLVSSLDCTTLGLNLVGTIIHDENAFFADTHTGLYTVTVENDVLSLTMAAFGDLPESNHGYEGIYNLGENRYLFFMSTYARFLDVKNGVVKDFTFAEEDPYKCPLNTFSFLDGCYYIFSVCEDLILYKFDGDFNLISQKVVLKDFDETFVSVYQIEAEFYNNSWLVSFEASPSAGGYGNTFLLLCTKNGQTISYYRYGNASALYTCKFVPISPYQILMIDESSNYLSSPEFPESCFTYLRTSCDGHVLGDWTQGAAPTCTEEGYNQRNCSKCNYFETESIPARGHNLGDWVEMLAPTCTEKGTERRDCSKCNHYETKDISATGHSDIDNDKVCDLCGWKESNLSGGAIVGIVVGSIVTAGAVGFSVFWFVIKKKRISDLLKMKR